MVLPALILNAEKDWGESEEAKITCGGGRGGLTGIIEKVDNTISCMSSENEA